MPRFAMAGLFSSILGNHADADSSNQSNQTSQNSGALHANGVGALVLQNTNNSSNSKDPKNTVDDSSTVNISNDSALLPATSPVGVTGTDNGDSSSNQTSVYVVRQGDSISQIANMFGVSVDTILVANNMKKGDKLTEGETLIILPISGIEHTVTKGETIQSIAKLYKVDPTDITGYNGLADGAKLSVGDQLMIPGGDDMSPESAKPIADKDLSASIAKDKLYYEQHPVQSLPGYFIDPVPGYRLSQGIHANNAVDLAIAKGTPIHAAAAGIVIFARNGYNGGFGNLVIISHPNGVQTLYAHQSKLNTHVGAEVSQGDIIGYVGSTGHSTGPHLHFEVHGARNPGVDGSWAQ